MFETIISVISVRDPKSYNVRQNENVVANRFDKPGRLAAAFEFGSDKRHELFKACVRFVLQLPSNVPRPTVGFFFRRRATRRRRRATIYL